MKKVATWIGGAAIITIIFGSIYGAVQQAQRSDANMPQIQYAQDTSSALNKGAQPVSLTPGRVNLQESLAPFTIIYSKDGKVISSNGFIGTTTPTIPFEVLKNSQNQDYNAVTWQPQNDVRIASVTVSANNYYVVSGRSLKEVEKNEDKTAKLTLAGWLLTLAIFTSLMVFFKEN